MMTHSSDLPRVPVYRRALRRWQRRKRLVRLTARARNWGMNEEQALSYVRLRVDTRQPCSCAMCRNRRKDEGPTRQERAESVLDETG